ncbi:HNH endonuclease [Salmonella enterica]|uniref:HNH endonuclease n=1 Tax=Citrobacter freundii TaxID=546 RepID=UPI0014141297|nr:HNH endonuclease signature motif containing protein [Citrobacter freundii]EAZ5991660.1 HNH endonuclease [Salmonella enterica]EBY2261580.1 HNH endonuclease [Salmonella enterica subsp. enterica serovar Newport]EBJ0730087.1 HNH endonuclease [Salmonella enterica]ECO6783066.1 HNH endonuclease [Salmonella enterica]ECO7514823.1 HNH endonuclease [Salmonella enterica]
MAHDRPAISEAIKREVRKQCGFGCAICGMPFFQYDHVEEYAEVQEHKVENLVLLCPNHHAAKTTNKLSKERIKEARFKPFNISREHTTPFKIEQSRELTTLLGTNSITGWRPDVHGDNHPIWINGDSFFTVHADNGWLTISIKVTDGKGNVLLSVERGELIVSTAAWDFVYEGENIKIRAGLGDILLDLNLSDTKVEVLKGMFLDQNLDGFIVQNGALILVFNDKHVGNGRGNQAFGFGYAGWGLLNTKSAPNVIPPRGFSFLFKN